MSRRKISVNAKWWSSLGSAHQELYTKTFRKVGLLMEDENPGLTDDIAFPDGNTFNALSKTDVQILKKKPSCDDRCEAVADAIAKWCEKEGGGAHDCLDEATDAYDCCMEECTENK